MLANLGSDPDYWPLVLSLLWLVVANVIAMFPSRDKHWRAAYVLIALGVLIESSTTEPDS